MVESYYLASPGALVMAGPWDFREGSIMRKEGAADIYRDKTASIVDR